MTYCGDHYTIYTYVESLCYTPKANIMLYANSMPKKFAKNIFKEGNVSERNVILKKTIVSHSPKFCPNFKSVDDIKLLFTFCIIKHCNKLINIDIIEKKCHLGQVFSLPNLLSKIPLYNKLTI